MLRRGEIAVFHGGNVAFYRILNVVLPFHEVFDKFWSPAGDAQAKHVMQHQHLPVSVRAGADTDDRYGYGPAQRTSQRG